MPTVKLPLYKGLAQNAEEADWVDSLPINLLSVKKRVLDADGYMHSWPGLTADVAGIGPHAVASDARCRNGIYDTETQSTFRINGDHLQEYTVASDGTVTVQTRVSSIQGLPANNGYTPIDFSDNTICYIADGVNPANNQVINNTLYFLEKELNVDGHNVIDQLSNWDDGEKAVGAMTQVFAVNFDGTRFVDIPNLDTSANGYSVSLEIGVEGFVSQRRYIIGYENSGRGLFIENNMVRLQLNDDSPPMVQDIMTIEEDRLNAIRFETQNAAGAGLYAVNFDGNTSVSLRGLNPRQFPNFITYFVSFSLYLVTVPAPNTIQVIAGFGVDFGNSVNGVRIYLNGTNLMVNQRHITTVSAGRSIPVSIILERGENPLVGQYHQLGAEALFDSSGRPVNGFIGEIRDFRIHLGGPSGVILIDYSLIQSSNTQPTNEIINSDITGSNQTARIVRTDQNFWRLSSFSQTLVAGVIDRIGGGSADRNDLASLFVGEIRNVRFQRNEVTGPRNIERSYSLYRLQPETETDPMDINIQESIAGDGSLNGAIVPLGNTPNWILSNFGASGVLSSNLPATNYDIDNILDVVRHGARYIYIRDNDRNFWITDIENERKVEYYSPSYDANSHYGTPVACESWRSYVVIFSKHTVTYFQLTGRGGSATQPIYQIDPSATVNCGAIHRGAVCRYADQFVVIGNPINEPISVYFISQGNYTELASRFIQQILRRKSLAQLAQAYIEPFKFDNHDGFILHLDDRTFVYDPSFKDFEWKQLTSNDASATYRGIYHVFEENRNRWTAGDRLTNVNNLIDFTIASHRGTAVLHQVDTPMVQYRNVKILDFEIDNIVGLQPVSQNIILQVTFDGQNYQNSATILYTDPADKLRRILERNLGYSKNNIGFRISWTATHRAAISNFRIRLEK